MTARRALGLAAAALLLALGCAPAAALDYPNRAITLIVPHKAGGPSDVIARVLSPMLVHVLRQSIVIENRPGAAGAIAAEHAANATPDGHTLLLGNTSILATAPARQQDLGYEPQLDFAPITLIGTQANVLVAHPGVSADSLEQLVQMARARPGFITFASAGHGSASHLAAELFKAEAKVDLVHVPYKKPGPALQDVVAGHVQIMFAPAALVQHHVRSGRLRALGLATTARSALLPGVATLDELGFSGFDATTWYGLVAPLGTPKEVIDVLYHSTGAVLEDAAARRIMRGLGIDTASSSPREFESYIRSQIPKWTTVFKSISHVH